jgi:hypothetical protein
MKSTRRAALFYASLGWPIFPVWSMRDGRCACGDPDCYQNRGKHPITYLNRRPVAPHGVQDATTDENTINGWWDAIPDANIGARGLAWFALDVDDQEALQILREKHGQLPDTVQNISGSGGYHFLFKQPEPPLGNDEGNLPDGINVRGANGYIILPPSSHKSGNSYEWEVSSHPRDTAVAIAPDWLVSLIRTNTTQAQPVTFSGTVPAEIPPLSKWKLSGYTLNLITGTPEGDRSQNDQKVLSNLRRAGASEDEIRAIFVHYPIGKYGKYAEKKQNGDKYLAHSIGKASAWVALHPPEDESVIQSLREVEPPLTPEQMTQVTTIIANLEGRWKLYHDEMTAVQRQLWRDAGIPEAAIDLLNLGYAAGLVDQETGEIVRPAGLTVPYTDMAGEVVNVEYRYQGGYAYEQDTMPYLFCTETTAGEDAPILAMDDSLTAVTTWLAFGHRYQVIGLPHLKLRPESVAGVKDRELYVLLEPGVITKGRGLRTLGDKTKYLRLPLPMNKLVKTGIDERGIGRLLRQARGIA